MNDIILVTISFLVGFFLEMIWDIIRKDKVGLVKVKPITIVKAEYIKGIMYVDYSDESKKEFKGDCTVWSELPFMDRCDSFTETRLLEIWKYLEHYGGVYPLSHLKK